MAKEHILVVDDEENILELVKYNLTKEGYGVTCVATGEEAVSEARAKTPDLVILDLMLPGVDGLDGMVSTFVPGRSPCLECLFPGPAPQKQPPAILGPLPGLVASIQSLEALKIILGLEGLLLGRLLYIRGAPLTFKEIEIKKNPDCVICRPLREGRDDA